MSPARYRGRPRIYPEGKRSQFGTRITTELRHRMEVEAERTGRTLSQVAECWMEAGEHALTLGLRLDAIETRLREITEILDWSETRRRQP